MTFGRPLAWGVAALLALSACSPGARDAVPFQGLWDAPAWGLYLSIDGGSVEIFEYSTDHCVSVAAGGARGIGDVLSRDGAHLVLVDAGRTVRFEAVGVLPQTCEDPPVRDARSVFDVVVATVTDRDTVALDGGWEERVASLRPASSADAPALFGAIQDLLSPVGDAELRLAAGDLGLWRASEPPGFSMPEDLVEETDGISTTTLDEAITYLGLTRLGGFAEDPEDSQRLLAAAADSATASSRRVILDLRGADGGSIDHAMLVASRFVPEPRVVAQLEARGPDGYVDAGEVAVTPHPLRTFAGSLFVLIGPGTIGVAELLATALGSVEGVTLVGGTTAGAAGPGMVRYLPNGWSLGLTNLRVTSSDGLDLTAGVTPDVVAQDALAVALDLARG